MGTDGWITSANFPAVLTYIRREFLRLRPLHEIVVVMDCAAQHCATNVIQHCRRLRLHVLLVPARFTWLLHPLDAHVFGNLKRRLAVRAGLCAFWCSRAGAVDRHYG